MSAKPKLECTNKYDQFVGHEHNRCDKRNPELAESMRKYGFLPSGAIHVKRQADGKLLIIRGHHRWLTAKELNIPLWFIVDETEVERLEDLETSGQDWSVSDHARSKSFNNDHYMDLLMFQKKHGLPIGAAANLLGGVQNSSKKIKSGTFAVGDRDHANAVVRVTDHLFGLGIKFARSAGFITALSRCFRVPEFDPNIVMQKATNFPKHMVKRGQSNEYLEEIEKLYNYASRKPIPLAFRAKEIGTQLRDKYFAKKEDKGDLVQVEAGQAQPVQIQPGPETASETQLFGVNQVTTDLPPIGNMVFQSSN